MTTVVVHISRASLPSFPDLPGFINLLSAVSYCGDLGTAPPVEPEAVKAMTALEMETIGVCPFCILRMIAHDSL